MDYLSELQKVLGPKLSDSGTDSIAKAALASNPVTAGLSAGMDMLGGMTGGTDNSKASATSGGTLSSAAGDWNINFGSSGGSNSGIMIIVVIAAIFLLMSKR